MNENDIFITSIEVKKVRNIENFIIPLSETERKHLIITGKNGSGKTSLLLELNKFISLSLSQSIVNYSSINTSYSNLNFILKKVKDELKKPLDYERFNLIDKSISQLQSEISIYGNTKIIFNHENKSNESYLSVLFEAKRFTQPVIPEGINKIELKENYQSTEKINQNFIQYIVNLKAERSFAKDDDDDKSVAEIDDWFIKFENQLKELFDAPNLQLIFDRKNYNFHLQIGNNEPFSLAELSDGYSAVLTIVTELILRMEATGNKGHDLQGIVLIDEIETHLHVALQKKIMPFLCAFFPNIQFIVTTHSPFVLSSISNAVICDLERKEVISEDLSGYSYHALVESYFDTDEYSEEVKIKLRLFELLSEKMELTEEEEDEYEELDDYFINLPKFRAKQLEVKLQQIQLKKLTQKG